jgi:predicted nucleic acid-binding protein
MALVYLDSSIVIYLVERHPIYAPAIERALTNATDITLAISPLVKLEVLVKPLQDGRVDLIALYRRFLGTAHSLSVNDATFDLALELRARHRLKTPDALHLAIANQHSCNQFWTNDNRLAVAAGSLNVNLLASSTE